jgi:hypothetical protein
VIQLQALRERHAPDEIGMRAFDSSGLSVKREEGLRDDRTGRLVVRPVRGPEALLSTRWQLNRFAGLAFGADDLDARPLERRFCDPGWNRHDPRNLNSDSVLV